jgi:Uma2 family endonuclease
MATADLALQTEPNRFILDGVDYQAYKAAADALGERPFRATFDGQRIEFMTTSTRHEGWKSFVGRMVEALSEELGLDIACFGSMTMRREDMERGLEPDECYYIQSEPLVGNRLDLDLEQDPPPDLAIEIEVTRSLLNRIDIYAALAIPEVWRFDGEHFQVLLLDESGRYEAAESSRSFPTLPLDEFSRFLLMREGTGDSKTIRAFRAWVRANLVPPTAAGDPPPPTVS